jgi:hypothetical protein
MMRFSTLLFVLLTLSISNSDACEKYPKDQNMFKTHQFEQPVAKQKNLKGIEFNERVSVENIIDELGKSSKDPYAASLPLIASAELGDEKRYDVALTQMLHTLDALETKPNDCPQWMRNNSFKAWMWGRVLLAANSMNDVKTSSQAKNKLIAFLNEKVTKEDSLAFMTWAWGYRAAANQAEYGISSKRMIDDAMQLTEKYKEEPKNHSALSDALWAWVMNLSAAATAGDVHNYALIKDQIKAVTGADSATKALETGLLRTAQSNDFPAWALAKMRFAAATMKDKELYHESEKAILFSIEGAKETGAKAEYILSVLDNQLAIHAGEELQVSIASSQAGR